MSTRRDAASESRHSVQPKMDVKQPQRRRPQHDSYETTQLFKHVPSLPTRCFFKISIDNLHIGDIVMELFGNEVPKTCENFRALCTGEAGVSRFSDRPLHYENTIFHRVIAGFMIQGGDFTAHNGTGGESIWGVKFPDESFKRKHDIPYLLSMANCGPNTNGSQFFVTCAPCPHLDDHHVVFGRVIEGQSIVRQIEEQATDSNDRPIRQCKITECGELVPQISTSATAGVRAGSSVNDVASSSRRSSRRDMASSRRSRSSSSGSSSSSSSSSSDSTTARALRKSLKERKRLERKLAKRLAKEKRRILKKLKKKKGKSKKHARKEKRSPSSSSSSSGSSSSERKKKKHKKGKKLRGEADITPKTDAAPSQADPAVAAPRYYCTVDPAEIPPVPEPKFLRRRATPPARVAQTAAEQPSSSENPSGKAGEDRQADRDDDFRENYLDRSNSTRYERRQLKPKHQSGTEHKRHKGRGDFFFGRGTPERWHQAERRLTKLPGDSSRTSEDDVDKLVKSCRPYVDSVERRSTHRREKRDKSDESREQRRDRYQHRRSHSRDSSSSSDYAYRRHRQERPREVGKVLKRRSRSRSIGEMSSSSSRDTAYSGKSGNGKPRHTLQSVIMPIEQG